MVIFRNIEAKLQKYLFSGKAIVVYGARRVGKTTLIKKLQEQYSRDSLYLNCDEPDIRRALTDKTSSELVTYLGQKKLVLIDEAQRVRNIGLTLKLLVDNAPGVQIIATGSSSFDLSNKIKEPLTGRTVEFHLFPLSLTEISTDLRETNRLLPTRLVYGSYPEVVLQPADPEETLRGIYKNYLYKDALEYQGIKNPDLVEKLLTALALQLGQEVSYTELGSLLGVDQKTIASYIRLLELGFVIFRLPPLSRNLRKEISKSRKIYFYDTGIRNAIINNFNPIEMRTDTGALWENLLIVERKKRNEAMRNFPNAYFWRTWTQQEIDYVEEEGGTLHAFEVKWTKGRRVPSTMWQSTYPGASWQIVTRDNYWDFIRAIDTETGQYLERA
ncbi:ATPase [Candidatus Gottesmanbacteria bacterium RIFCSPHIGHO2_01_FULL_46_14]|uniref:ATPase n=2 Tax=Candidatus Gottesmaniibacteriota TaxID=1752720 RepID=A0A1F5ZMB6_9BACT|nr:MAG: ATPase [Candidatus Gottesmanbacteria bacterium RIFCSPHIGHO2_01_FULL_46_14]OGG28963.1 MAG: ATPase [Candidatus Gottesmanbacteria bacterium RIFCSPLOWO2_01_FULL_46_21]